MGKIYVGQTALRITLITHVDVSGANTIIKVKKPGEDVIEWDATIEDSENGKIYYDIQDGDLDISGQYKLWAYINFANGTVAPGETVYLNIYTEGD